VLGHITTGLDNGFLHPLLGPDHLLAMVAVGVLAVILNRALAVPVTFVAAMVVGGSLGMGGVSLPLTEPTIVLSVVALGGALVAGQMIRPELALGLVALAGVAHGHAHGAEAPTAAHPLAYVAGFVVATALLHAFGVAVGFGIRQNTAVRATLGTLVATAGIGLFVGVV
jgi:urease accessory protein